MELSQESQPEAYYLEKGTLVPNNRLPALVYRNVFPLPIDQESACAHCAENHWEMRVGSYFRYSTYEMGILWAGCLVMNC